MYRSVWKLLYLNYNKSFSLTPKISHHSVSILIQQNIMTGRNTCIIYNEHSYFRLPILARHTCYYCGTHLLRSLWMIGWVRLCRYSMPLATSMAMMSLDCRSMSLSIDTSLKQQTLSSRSMSLCQSHTPLLHRSIGQCIKTAPGPTVSRTLHLDQWWSWPRRGGVGGGG